MVVNIKRKIDKSIDSTKSKLDKSLERTKARLKKTARNITTSPVDKIKSGIPIPANVTVVKEVLTGRDNYPVKVLSVLKTHGNDTITAIRIKRTPVSKLLTKTLSTVSSEFGKRLKESPYDQLFHLFLEVKLKNKTLYIEKNEVIAITSSQGKRPHEEVIEVTTVPQGLTLDTLMNRTKQLMGPKFFKYDASKNNCQDFIVAILKANKIGTTKDIGFVKQDTKFLFNNLPYLRKFSNTVTTIGSRVDVIKNISII